MRFWQLETLKQSDCVRKQGCVSSQNRVLFCAFFNHGTCLNYIIISNFVC